MRLPRILIFHAVMIGLAPSALIAWTGAAVADVVVADVVVSPEGNDAGSGKATAPFATLLRAQQAIREMKLREPRRGRPFVVLLRGGTYRLTAPIVFTPEDSGTPQAPVIYQAAAGERPILSGGVRITGWQKDRQGRWQVTLPEVKAGDWNFAQLFVNDQRRFRPRVPRAGYHQIAGELPPSDHAQGKGFDRFLFRADDVNPRWANLGDVEVLALRVWKMARMRIAHVDPVAHEVRLSGHTDGMDTWTKFAPGNRYLVENVKEALGEPGQWYLDRPTGVLTYIPQAGEKLEDVTVVAPKLTELVRFAGRPEGNQPGRSEWVEHIELRGLDYAHANWVTPLEGQTCSQAEINLGGAIAATWTRKVRIADCVVRHVGVYAIDLGAGCRENRIENCELVDLGAGGVKIGVRDDQRSLQDSDLSLGGRAATGNIVRNCTIAHAGRLHPAAVGVWIGHASHTTVEHNDIFDLYYTGVSVGWVWGYGPSPAHHNRIRHNHIHTLGQGVLSDMAGVYTLGVSPGTVVEHNVIHDVDGFQYGGWGLYCDEGASNIHMHDNLVYRTKDGSFHQHYGRDNLIENNILALSQLHQLSRQDVEDNNSFTLRRNIVYWSGPQEALHGDWQRNVITDLNLYWNAAGSVLLNSKTLAERQRIDQQDRGSIVADPLFVAPEKGDFRLRPGSPAGKLGFRAFDATKAGRESPARLTTGLPESPRAFP